MAYSEYRNDMVLRFRAYAREAFRDCGDCFEPHPSETRPPVFVKEAAWRNVLLRPGADQTEISGVLSAMPAEERHRWFRSMTSSQALALSVFGNLKWHGMTTLLDGLRCEQGMPVFAGRDLSPSRFRMEYEVRYLGEPRPTSVDVFLDGPQPMPIECKLTEPEVGPCSRPRLDKDDSAYEEQYCDGNYAAQQGRAGRCPLTERGVQYWNVAPKHFHLDPERDYAPCPLRFGYQLVRNVLAAAEHPQAKHTNGPPFALLIYDARNPEFQPGGAAHQAFEDVSALLKNKEMLRKCTWQALIEHLRTNKLMPWLSDGLEHKYGF